MVTDFLQCDSEFHFISAETFSGETLSLSSVKRSHMGAYLCIASNDVPPAVSKRVILNVNCKSHLKFHYLLPRE